MKSKFKSQLFENYKQIKNNNYLPSFNTFYKEIESFLKSISKDREIEFKEELLKITRFELFDKFTQSIANYNYQNEISNKFLNIKFIIICAAIESFYKLNAGTRGDSKKVFKKFLNNSNIKSLVTDKINVESISDVFDFILEYIYKKRSDFVHEGVHFNFFKPNSTTSQNIPISGNIVYNFEYKSIKYKFEYTFSLNDFKELYLAGLLQNLKKENKAVI